MKSRLITLVFLTLAFFSCREKSVQESEFTGREITYQLLQTSDYSINGAVTFKERYDETTVVQIHLDGTEGDRYFPVHLHVGNIFLPDAEVAAFLTPVNAATGESETHLTYLGDESPITYQQLIDMDASIKIHLAAEGLDSKVILVAGNVGSNGIEISKDTFAGRIVVPVCQSY